MRAMGENVNVGPPSERECGFGPGGYRCTVVAWMYSAEPIALIQHLRTVLRTQLNYCHYQFNLPRLPQDARGGP